MGLCSKFYDDVVVFWPKPEEIKPWEMTERYSFPTALEFQEVMNSFKGTLKKL